MVPCRQMKQKKGQGKRTASLARKSCDIIMCKYNFMKTP